MTIWQIWWISLAVKMALLPFLPISPDEAYYFAWARHPQLSYYDHPPFVSWIMSVGYLFWKTPFGVRPPGVLLAHMSYLPWIILLRKMLFKEKAIKIWLFLLLFNPMTGLGSFIVTPDIPMGLFWSLGVLALFNLEKNPSLKNWSILGLVVGLGLLSKYVMVLFVIAGVTWLVLEGRREILLSWKFLVSILIAIAIFSPVLIWNYNNNFASLLFQTKHGLGESPGFQLTWLLEYLGAQFGLLNPLVVIGVLFLYFSAKNLPKILTVFSFFPILFFAFTSLLSRVEANWPFAAYPAIMALGVLSFNREAQVTSKKLIRYGLGLSVAFSIAVVAHVIHPWLPIEDRLDRSFTLREWQRDNDAVSEFHPLFARSYQLAAYLSLYRPKDREVFKLANYNRRDFYDFIPESQPQGLSYVVFDKNEVFPTELTNRFNLDIHKELPTGHVLYRLTLREPK